MCQMDVVLRFWNEKKGQVETKYFDSRFLTHPNAKDLYSSAEISMKGLVKTKLFQFGMNRPNVDWNALNIFDDKLELENFPKTLKIVVAPSILFMGHSKMDFRNLPRR